MGREKSFLALCFKNEIEGCKIFMEKEKMCKKVLTSEKKVIILIIQRKGRMGSQ